jgi:hypothetical protein
MRYIVPDFRGILGEGAVREGILQIMRNLNGLGVDSFECDQTVLFNGSRQYPIPFIVDVLSNNVDSPRGP